MKQLTNEKLYGYNTHNIIGVSLGMTGFREKNWTINENTNDFQGIYQWTSREMAEHYPDTFIFKLMTKRAAPGTISYEIMPNTDLVEYISNKSL
jgi:hypothetical protein